MEFARLRFVDNIPTVEIMERLRSHKDRDYLAVVSLLDVKKQELREAVEADDPTLLDHLLDCRVHVTQYLEKAGIHIKEK